MNGWLIETTILIQYHCKNGKEKQHNQAGRTDILINIESWIGIKNRFETSNPSINRNVPNHWLITEQFSIIDLLLDFDKASENGRNIYEWNQINQTILEIDFDRTFSNEKGRLTFRRLGISKHDQYSIFRNTFQCQWTRIFETIPFRINGFKLWQIYWNHLDSYQSHLSILTNMNHIFFHEVHICRV